MKWPEGVRKSGGGWRAVIMLDDGELLELGVWGLDRVWLQTLQLASGLARPGPAAVADAQRTKGISNGSSWIGSRDLLRHDPAGSEVSNYHQRKESKWLRT